MMAFLAPLVWIWFGGALVLTYVVALTSQDCEEPFTRMDLLVCATWPIYLAVDLFNRYQDPRP